MSLPASVATEMTGTVSYEAPLVSGTPGWTWLVASCKGKGQDESFPSSKSSPGWSNKPWAALEGSLSWEWRQRVSQVCFGITPAVAALMITLKPSHPSHS